MKKVLPESITVLLSEIDTSNFSNAREDCKGDGWEEFKASIKRFGIQNPPVVRRIPGGYELIQGFRRVLAATELELGSVRVTAYAELSDQDARALNLVENLQRKELHWTEFAWGVSELRRVSEADGKPRSGASIAHEIGVSPAVVTQHLVLAECAFFDNAMTRHREGQPLITRPLANELEKLMREAEADSDELCEAFEFACDNYVAGEGLKLAPTEEETGDNDAAGAGSAKPPSACKLYVTAKAADETRRVLKKAGASGLVRPDGSEPSEEYYAGVVDTLAWMCTQSGKLPLNVPEDEAEEKPAKKSKGGRQSRKGSEATAG